MNRFVTLLLTLTALLILALPAASQDQSNQSKSSYNAYGKLLAKAVDGKFVNYDVVIADREDLDMFIAELGSVLPENLDRMSRDEQVALWINAFNAITLRSVIDVWPILSVRSVDGFLEKKRWFVAGRNVTLEDIRQNILITELDEPRAFFVINDGTAGAPPLQPIIFHGQTLDQQLDQILTRMINDNEQTVINTQRQTIELSSLFSWLGRKLIPKYASMEKFKHLDEKSAAVLNFIWKYASPEVKIKLETAREWKIGFLPYPFLLNSRTRPPVTTPKQTEKPTE